MTSEHLTSAIAGAAITAPAWAFDGFLTAGILPVLGATWLLTQIVCRIVDTARGGGHGRKA